MGGGGQGIQRNERNFSNLYLKVETFCTSISRISPTRRAGWRLDRALYKLKKSHLSFLD